MADLSRWQEVAREILANNGGTYDREGYPLLRRAGYWVGGALPCLTFYLPRENTASIARRLRYYASGLPEGVYLGVWVNGDYLYLDRAEWCQDREEAARIGRGRGELAIYACAAGREVKL